MSEEQQILIDFDPVQECADKLRKGCGCENCFYLETEFCSTCVHLSNWCGDEDPRPLPYL